MSRGPDWTDAELAIVRCNLHLSAAQIAAKLPGRSRSALSNVRLRLLKAPETPPVKAPGDYVETLSEFIVDDFDCMQIWMKWNGYACYRELRREQRGFYVQVLCTAK